MFSYAPRASRRVRFISAAVAAGAMIAAFGMTAGSASAIGPVAPGPANVTVPSITGYTGGGPTPVVGNTLTAHPGAWSDASADPATIEYTYTWVNDDEDTIGTGETYVVQASDIGDFGIFLHVVAVDANEDNAAANSDESNSAIASPVSNTVLPVITGSVSPGGTVTVSNGTWTSNSPGFVYSFSWGYHGISPDGSESGGAVDGTTNSITIDSAREFDAYIVAFVTATDSQGNQATVRVQSATVVTPAAPFATDAGLTAANEGTVTGSQTKTDATVVLPSNEAPATAGISAALSPGVSEGSIVYVYGYSTPTPIGFFSVSAANTITVPLGALPKGLHKLAIIDPNGNLIGWLSVTAGGGLASTGVNVNAPLELGGAGLLILLGILSVVFVTRQRRISA